MTISIISFKHISNYKQIVLKLDVLKEKGKQRRKSETHKAKKYFQYIYVESRILHIIYIFSVKLHRKVIIHILQ